jgi:drug/metabolite transporter (DMT)-like permease
MAQDTGARREAGAIAGRLSPILAAAGAMLVAGITSSLLHIGVRHVSPYVPTFEIVFLRSLLTIAFTMPFLWYSGRMAWRTKRPGLQLVRGMVGVLSMSSWYYSLALLPLADAGALSFTTAIFVTIGAAVWFGEPVGFRRWTAVLVGLLGALVVMRPGSGVVSIPAIAAAGSSVLWALSLLIAKELNRDDSVLTVSFYQPLMIAPFAGIAMIPTFVWPPMEAWLILTGMGAVAAISNFAYLSALRMADASIMMPLDYVRLVWMAAWGYLIFGEVPDLATWIGALLIVAAAAFITVRERQLAAAGAREGSGA